ncbi:MAG: DUF924 family protein [Acetobacteraceae bacterium]
MSVTAAATPEEVLGFWFSAESEPFWFRKDEAFDSRVRSALLAPHLAAARGDLAPWGGDAEGALALALLLDQAPRNLFRGRARAFATDAAALAVARTALERGFDLALPVARRPFLYLPFEHSEALEDQHLSVRLFRERIGEGEYLTYAIAHLEVIARFGRFPHRNAALGRTSTAAEEAYLAEPGAGF